MGRRITAVTTAALLLLGGATAALAHPVEGWIQDVEGDANFLNTQGLGDLVGDNPLDPGVSTGQAQVAPADIRAVRFATDYEAVPVGDDGIEHVATGVTISIVTEVTPRADGPTTMYRLIVNPDGACNSFIQAYLRGNASLPEDPAHRRSEWRKLDDGCPDGAATVALPDAEIDEEEAAIVLRIPYEALSPAQESAFDPGSILSGPQGSTRTVFSWGSLPEVPYSGVTAPQIDETVVGEDWVVGQDLPEDVPCTLDCPGDEAAGEAATGGATGGGQL